MVPYRTSLQTLRLRLHRSVRIQLTRAIFSMGSDPACVLPSMGSGPVALIVCVFSSTGSEPTHMISGMGSDPNRATSSIGSDPARALPSTGSGPIASVSRHEICSPWTRQSRAMASGTVPPHVRLCAVFGVVAYRFQLTADPSRFQRLHPAA